MKTLILGGTREGRDLAQLLDDAGHDVLTSLAGRVSAPAKIAGQIRVGGFGGADGLAAWLAEHGVAAVVDATHPFAEQISANAAAACRAAGVPLLRIARPSWQDHPLAETWTWVGSHDEAAIAAAGYDRVMLTVGKQSVDYYRALPNVVARMLELPKTPLPESWTVLQERGPFTVEDEAALLRNEGIAALVTKDSGGALTQAKLEAAARVGTQVIIIRRAAVPAGIEQVRTAQEAFEWVISPGSRPRPCR